ncbi:replication restart helicase PriA [Microbacter margulisiae]|uniref:Replication restart protein PriA n=1 Tax=Microbacter margulisiae TaxID=1350067 RepID=A0A7W5DQJ1_9PORP|nr:primosomal protein N' [Microbacter margulisiae]MBB3186930.1 primosomal protein N' (replication factor Y) [Microbacter margulisiae]
MTPRFAEVIMPLPIEGTFTYSVPEELSSIVKIGMRVVVTFGTHRLYTGIIQYLHLIPPDTKNVKPIFSLLDEEAILIRPQLDFWEWMATYYMASLGDVYVAALPSGLRLENETLIRRNPEVDKTLSFSSRESRIWNAISEDRACSIQELIKRTESKHAVVWIKSLMDKKAVIVSQTITDTYKPRTISMVKAAFNKDNEQEVQTIFERLKRAEKQLSLLITYLDLSQLLSKQETKPVSKQTLLEKSGASVAVLNGLVDKKILQLYDQPVSRLTHEITTPLQEAASLNLFQTKAYQSLLDEWKTKQTVLLHGVTSSGKTEIYIHAIQKVIALGRQVLYLVPEIALTTQLTHRLARVFGSKLGIYHSKFNDNERIEVWKNLLHREGLQIILGARSSIFLPFHDLGLVIIDEEHETSYKQQDSAPRYHARDAAIMLAHLHSAKVLLGTATPSIETYQNALSGKYGFVELKQRYEGITLPRVASVDLKEAFRKKQTAGHFSDTLIEAISGALSRREQVILFHNRRGYAPYVECPQCAYVPKCKYCDVSLTYHKQQHKLICHYCGFSQPLPDRCPSCGNNSLKIKGLGTEKIEDEVSQFFPNAKISRLDLDVANTRKGFERIITAFEQHETDILIGTQMVAKGLDFANVSLVGVLNADVLFHYPDFRAHERAFQLLSQVSGRSGRKGKQGNVLIQTMDPNHAVLPQVIAHDYISMFRTQMKERYEFCYPPYYRLIVINLRHKDENTVHHASERLAKQLRKLFSDRVLGPEIPPIGRLHSWYMRTLLLKIESNRSSNAAKKMLKETIAELQAEAPFQSVQINFDVDPM